MPWMPRADRDGGPAMVAESGPGRGPDPASGGRDPRGEGRPAVGGGSGGPDGPERPVGCRTAVGACGAAGAARAVGSRTGGATVQRADTCRTRWPATRWPGHPWPTTGASDVRRFEPPGEPEPRVIHRFRRGEGGGPNPRIQRARTRAPARGTLADPTRERAECVVTQRERRGGRRATREVMLPDTRAHGAHVRRGAPLARNRPPDLSARGCAPASRGRGGDGCSVFALASRRSACSSRRRGAWGRGRVAGGCAGGGGAPSLSAVVLFVCLPDRHAKTRHEPGPP